MIDLDKNKDDLRIDILDQVKLAMNKQDVATYFGESSSPELLIIADKITQNILDLFEGKTPSNTF